MRMDKANTIVGIFRNERAARAARDRLIAAGIPERRMVVSRTLTDDGIAGEYPRQSFENQPGQPPSESASARYGEAVRSGACTLSVESESAAQREEITAVLRRNGAFNAVSPPE
jgi:hypothetical protein